MAVTASLVHIAYADCNASRHCSDDTIAAITEQRKLRIGADKSAQQLTKVAA